LLFLNDKATRFLLVAVLVYPVISSTAYGIIIVFRLH
jgi:hypothetical protein